MYCQICGKRQDCALAGISKVHVLKQREKGIGFRRYEMKKSMIDVAYELMSKKKKAMTFAKLWEEVTQALGMDEMQKEEAIAHFYSDLSLDTRFLHVGDNKWDLRNRHTFNETIIDTSALLIDDEAEDSEALEEAEEEKETNEEFD